MTRIATLALGFALCFGCGGDEGTPDAPGDEGAQDDAPADADGDGADEGAPGTDAGDGDGADDGGRPDDGADDDGQPGDGADDDDDGTDTGPPPGGEGIAADYPGDVGLADHPAVIFFEDFEHPDVGALTAGWNSATLPEAFTLVDDVPAGAAAGARSLLMQVGDAAGVSLYESLPDQHGDVYVRYYAKYNDNSAYHHSGMWLGGYNPPTPWPQGTAGIRPNGADFFHDAFEPAGSNAGLSFDQYASWPGMDCFMDPGGCWGNSLLRGSEPSVPADAWVCVELMIGMNTPGESDGQFAIWMGDELLQHVGPGMPTFNRDGVGVWAPDPAGEAFPGFNWRSAPEYGMNFVWLDFYTDGPSAMGWDQVVVATERIGCMTPA